MTSGHIASSPRTVKEADALAAAGASVRVVSLQTISLLKDFDAQLAATKAWHHVPLDVSREAARTAYFFRAAAGRAAAALPGIGRRFPAFGARAFSSFSSTLASAVRAYPADLYVAHSLAALAAASGAARRWKARLGFDAEDYHPGEIPDGPAYSRKRAQVIAIEDHYLPMCDYQTASSPEIARMYAQRSGRPVTCVLNVFPLAERPLRLHSNTHRPASPFSLYWFSQTIGPNRGLEQAIEILSRCRTAPLLQIRGTGSRDFIASLLERAKARDMEERLHFLERAAPDRMVHLAAGHDAGLSVDGEDTLNRRLCLANKIFTYLLAGVPPLLSDTQAHKLLAPELGDAARLLPAADPAGAACIIDDLLGDPGTLLRARRAAWELGQTRYNWETERERFLGAVESAL